MAKQFGLEQLVRQRRAVDVTEPPFAAGTQLMDRACDQLLAGAAFSSKRSRNGNGKC
jgi:hypothetical protein